MDVEAGFSLNTHKKESWMTVLTLAYQSLGVVYGDLSLSPLYVYKSTFGKDLQLSENNEEILGVFSFVFWTLTLVPLFKYVFIVLKADDNGEGGTFALYSLLCRCAKVGLLSNCQIANQELSTYKIGPIPETNNGSRIKRTLEKHRSFHCLLLIVALLGTCMVIGGGVLTPAISVFSAVSGLEFFISKEHHQHAVVPITCFILMCLFALQHYGTHRLSFMFAPIVATWLLCISALGLYNIILWNPQIYRALSPFYMYKFIKKNRWGGWKSLGGILLCATGSQALFEDLGHFSQLSIKIAFTSMVYPALILAYMGQAAHISGHQKIDSDNLIGFYISVPDNAKWPVIAIAILASVVGSQAIITGTFSTINESFALGFFPRVKVVHTSDKVHGRVYIPEINWILMILCISVTLGFRDIKHLGDASGLTLITAMLVTTFLMSLVITLCWHKNFLQALSFVTFFGSIETFYLSASLIKIAKGAWVSLILSLMFMTVMCVWHYMKVRKYEFDLQEKVSLEWLTNLGPSLGLVRIPGIGFIYTELVTGIPAIFSHLITNLPAIHQVIVFVCIKSIPVPFVPPEERYLIGRVGPKEFKFYRCIVRYGYRETHKDNNDFENQVISSIGQYIYSEGANSHPKNSSTEGMMSVIGTPINSQNAIAVVPSPSTEGTMSVNGAPIQSRNVIAVIPSYKSEENLPSTTMFCIRSPAVQSIQDYSGSGFIIDGNMTVIGAQVQSQSAPAISSYEAEEIIQSNTMFCIRSPAIQSNQSYLSRDFSAEVKMTVIGTPVKPGNAIAVIPCDEAEEYVQSTTTSYISSPTIQGIRYVTELNSPHLVRRKKIRNALPISHEMDSGVQQELQELLEAKESGITYILGHSYVKARRGSVLLKKLVIVAYNFLKTICMGPPMALSIPHTSLLEIGMVYSI